MTRTMGRFLGTIAAAAASGYLVAAAQRSTPPVQIQAALVGGAVGAALVMGDRHRRRPNPIHPSGVTAPGTALFWDFENVNLPDAPSAREQLARLEAELQRFGQPRLRRIYANWNNTGTSLNRLFFGAGYEQVQVSLGKRNSVDVKLVVDCLDLAHRQPDLHTFVILSADKDFVALIHALRALGRRVVVLGLEVSEELRRSADEAIELGPILHPGRAIATPASEEEASVIPFESSRRLIGEAVVRMLQHGGLPSLEQLEEALTKGNRRHYRGPQSLLDRSGTPYGSLGNWLHDLETEGTLRLWPVQGQTYLELAPENGDRLGFSEAVGLLRQAIVTARSRGVPTGLSRLDELMREAGGRYRGCRSLLRLDGRSSYGQFSRFALDACRLEAVRSLEVDGQTLLYLASQGPEPLPLPPRSSLDPEQWEQVFELIDSLLAEQGSLRYSALNRGIGDLRRSGQLPLSSRGAEKLVRQLMDADLFERDAQGRLVPHADWRQRAAALCGDGSSLAPPLAAPAEAPTLETVTVTPE